MVTDKKIWWVNVDKKGRIQTISQGGAIDDFNAPWMCPTKKEALTWCFEGFYPVKVKLEML